MEQQQDFRDYLPALLAILVSFVFPYLVPTDLRPVTPTLGLSILFFWRYRSDFPIWAALACGALIDLTQAMPLGVGISAALLMLGLARPKEEREENERFIRHMFRFAWVSLLTMGWIYLLMSLIEQYFFPFYTTLFQWLALLASYPLLYRFCHTMHQAMGSSRLTHRP